MSAAADDSGARTSAAGLLDELLDELIGHCAEPAGVDDVSAARKAFDERRGRVFEDEELWERWTQAFLEWYVLERVGPNADAPPVVVALRREQDPKRRTALRALVTSQRSLFEVRALRPGGVELHDLLGGGEFGVDEQRALHGVAVGDVAELRLVGLGGQVLFGRTFCFHPSGTRVAIGVHARRILEAGGDRREVMDHCASLRVRCERYRHVSAVRVYQAAAARQVEASAP
jgi:hypothetical protein